MVDLIHQLIERFGLAAVLFGCVAEGESAAILGGFFAHQGVFDAWKVLAAAFLGSFIGDMLFFFIGRYFSGTSFVHRLRQRPVFSYACRMVQAHPAPYVLLNRYVYGFRLVGGVVAGISDIGLSKFMTLNALAALVWSLAFVGIGYGFGLGAEQAIGAELGRHERLLFAVGLGAVMAIAGWYVHRGASRWVRKGHRA